MKRDNLILIFTGVAVLCALVIAGAVVRREFFPAAKGESARARSKEKQEPVFVTAWERYLEDGRRIGPTDAPVVVLEFGDYECPACERIERTALRPVRRRFPDQVAVVFRHWPLEYHRFAYPAAKASECAAAQGQFPAYHDLLYAKHDSLGLITFQQLAQTAGIPDLKAFDACYSSADRVPSIERGIRAAQDVGGQGTPTILVNGWRLTALPDSAKMEELVIQALQRAGKQP